MQATVTVNDVELEVEFSRKDGCNIVENIWLDELDQLELDLVETSELAHQLEAASKSLWEECHKIEERRTVAQGAVRRIATYGLFINESV